MPKRRGQVPLTPPRRPRRGRPLGMQPVRHDIVLVRQEERVDDVKRLRVIRPILGNVVEPFGLRATERAVHNAERAFCAMDGVQHVGAAAEVRRQARRRRVEERGDVGVEDAVDDRERLSAPAGGDVLPNQAEIVVAARRRHARRRHGISFEQASVHEERAVVRRARIAQEGVAVP